MVWKQISTNFVSPNKRCLPHTRNFHLPHTLTEKSQMVWGGCAHQPLNTIFVMIFDEFWSSLLPSFKKIAFSPTNLRLPSNIYWKSDGEGVEVEQSQTNLVSPTKVVYPTHKLSSPSHIDFKISDVEVCANQSQKYFLSSHPDIQFKISYESRGCVNQIFFHSPPTPTRSHMGEISTPRRPPMGGGYISLHPRIILLDMGGLVRMITFWHGRET